MGPNAPKSLLCGLFHPQINNVLLKIDNNLKQDIFYRWHYFQFPISYKILILWIESGSHRCSTIWYYSESSSHSSRWFCAPKAPREIIAGSLGFSYHNAKWWLQPHRECVSRWSVLHIMTSLVFPMRWDARLLREQLAEMIGIWSPGPMWCPKDAPCGQSSRNICMPRAPWRVLLR